MNVPDRINLIILPPDVSKYIKNIKIESLRFQMKN